MQVVNVVFSSFGVEQTAGCTYDYLSVYDGTDNKTGTLIGQFCGTLLPAELIRSTGTSLFLYFVSDVDSGSTGFTLTWTAVSPTRAYRTCSKIAACNRFSLSKICMEQQNITVNLSVLYLLTLFCCIVLFVRLISVTAN